MTKSLREDFMLFVEDEEIYTKYDSLNEIEKVDADRNVFMKYFSSLLHAHEQLNIKEITKTNGDVTKLNGLGLISGKTDALVFLKLSKIYDDSSKKPDAYTLDFFNTLNTLMKNLISNKNIFVTASRNNNKFISTIYIDAVLAVVMGTNLLIAQTVEMDKESGKMDFRKNLTQNNTSNTIMNTSIKLNEMFANGQIKKMINSNLSESVTLNEFFSELAIGVAVIISLLFIVKKLVWLFFHISQELSEYFGTLSDFVTDNYRTLDPKKDKKIIDAQKKWSNKLNKWSDKLEVRDHNTSKKVNNTIKKENDELNNSMSMVVSTKQANSDVKSNGFIF